MDEMTAYLICLVVVGLLSMGTGMVANAGLIYKNSDLDSATKRIILSHWAWLIFRICVVLGIVSIGIDVLIGSI